MKKNEASYRQIMKATSLFGGVQVFNILISIVRSKIIAILLGPAGMGIAGLFTSTTGLISAMTNFGLGTSAIRNVAEANESGNRTRVAKVVTVFRRLLWITGMLGVVITIILSSWLSEIVFGNKKYTMAFIWLSSTLLFTQLTSGQNVLLQGMRKLKYLAKASLMGSVLSLLVSIPLYYFYQIDGIVPALIITSILTFVITRFFAKKINIESVSVTRKEASSEGKNMLQMGIMLSLSSLFTLGASFVLRIFINNTGGVGEVGLYTAGIAIISTYTGLVLTAMSKDYYPRLSGVANDTSKSNLLVNQQMDIGILILAPILAIFIIFINWIVVLLYSTKFLLMNSMIQWAALGMYFKVASWCLGYILLAKGATKAFFFSELSANLLNLGLNILGYKLLGLEGLGISYAVGYMLYFLQIYFVTHYMYKFSFNSSFYKIFGIQLAIGMICLLIVKVIPKPWFYIIGVPLIVISAYYSFKELDKRIGIKGIVMGYLNK